MARIKNVFNFLKEYNELTNPVITEINKQEWSMDIINLPQIKEVWSIYNAPKVDEIIILEVSRPIMQACPEPSMIIAEWIYGRWNDVGVKQVSYKNKIVKEIKLEDGTVSQEEERFQDSAERVEAFLQWREKRNNWLTVETPKKEGLDLYNKLFALYSDMKKESESFELILGDGHIRWNANERLLDHPVLLQKVELVFDPEKPSFTVKCEELKTELYTPMLRVIPSINQIMLADMIKEVEENQYHIADINNTSGFFQRLASILDEKGKWVEKEEEISNNPTIMNRPIIFLRKRTLGFSNLINEIIADIENTNGDTVPPFFKPIVGEYPDDNHTEVSEENWNYSGIDEEVLLTLPANNEQLKIIKYLNRYNAVLVQGPPGTGKTHTISNLIGHLLSEGNSVLVTSHTEKALTVLKDKVYKDLQSLCISLLSSSSQKKEMDATLFEIAEKGTALDLNMSLKRIERLKEERKQYVEDYKAKQKELLQIRSLEYKDIVYDNKTLTPIEAAKYIKQGVGRLDYIPGGTKDDTLGLPIDLNELNKLYQSNDKITVEEEAMLSKELPAVDEIWSTKEFSSKKDSYLDLKNKLENWNPNVAFSENSKNIGKEALVELMDEAVNMHDSLSNIDEFQALLIAQTIKDSICIEFWKSIFKEYDELMDKYKEYRSHKFENEFKISDEIICEEYLCIINEIVESKKDEPLTGITLLFKPKWKKIKESIYVNNNLIEKRTDLEKASLIIEYDLSKIALHSKASKLIKGVTSDVSISIERFEIEVEQLRKKVLLSLNWFEQSWLRLKEKVLAIAENKEKLDITLMLNNDNLIGEMIKKLEEVIIKDISQQINKISLHEAKEELSSYLSKLKAYLLCGNPFEGLICAIENKDDNLYEANYNRLIDIYGKSDIYKVRQEGLKRLGEYAPMWANAIIERQGIHGEPKVPDDIEAAWKWLQLDSQIKRIDCYDPNKIQHEIEKINDSLIKNAQRLAYEKAWYSKIRNKTIQQTQAIEGWRTTIKQIGKGKGKTAPMLFKKARELMPLCQSAIPVWIMPLNRVAENFDPQKNKFDVVIIDEASQAGILALSALYLGKKVIIVGDDEQVSPNTVGLKVDEINALIKQHLVGVPNNHLFNDKTSIYDIAKSSGFKPLMLTEHFRCLPEIIGFSNQLSYNGKIKPLRDSSGINITPAVIEYRVPNSIEENKININESKHIASLIMACIQNEEYAKKTIGVISLKGTEQALEIDKILQKSIEPVEYEKRKIQCGTASQFQGDERDIIFLSIVAAPNDNGGPARLMDEEGRNDLYRKTYNVAASRAKEQMWVVHSFNPEIDLKPHDIRLKLIKYAKDPNVSKSEENLRTTESDFEKQVMILLLNKGYQVKSQWKVGAYKIDMVVEDDNRRVAIECDGEKWHTQDDLPNDLKRQAILERLGWKFIRIRGSAFYRNPDEAMEKVYLELEKYRIYPNYSGINDDSELEDNRLLESIKRMATQIRAEWEEVS